MADRRRKISPRALPAIRSMRWLGDGQQHKKHMNQNGKKARKDSGMNRHEIKRAMRAKRHEALASAPYNPKIGTNARMAAKRAVA